MFKKTKKKDSSHYTKADNLLRKLIVDTYDEPSFLIDICEKIVASPEYNFESVESVLNRSKEIFDDKKTLHSIKMAEKYLKKQRRSNSILVRIVKIFFKSVFIFFIILMFWPYFFHKFL